MGGREAVDAEILDHEAVMVARSLDPCPEDRDRLFDLFEAHGWICESEVPGILVPTREGPLRPEVDGEQTWRNPAIAHHVERIVGEAAS